MFFSHPNMQTLKNKNTMAKSKRDALLPYCPHTIQFVITTWRNVYINTRSINRISNIISSPNFSFTCFRAPVKICSACLSNHLSRGLNARSNSPPGGHAASADGGAQGGFEPLLRCRVCTHSCRDSVTSLPHIQRFLNTAPRILVSTVWSFISTKLNTS